MKIEFNREERERYVVNPRTEKRNGKRYLKADICGCEYIIVWMFPLQKMREIFSEEVKDALKHLAETKGSYFLKLTEEEIEGTEKKFSICAFVNYKRSGDAVEIPDRPASLAVCGAKYDKSSDTFVIYLPDEKLNYKTDISMEIRYMVRPYQTARVISKGFFRRKIVENREEQGVYEVKFEASSGYTDAGIWYEFVIKGKKYCYPVTAVMLGKSVRIRCPEGNSLKFQAVSGIVLKKVEGL
ncbi:MAG: hypothetical protein Q4E24_01665 [bacterium]|nr:hypothetical protein [bacterium]